MAQDRSENRMIMIMMIIMLLCILFLNNLQGTCILTIYLHLTKGPMRYLGIFWKNWRPVKQVVCLVLRAPGHQGRSGTNASRPFEQASLLVAFQWANKQGEGGSTEGISCVNDHPGLFCLSKATESRAAKVKGPGDNCWSHQMNELPGPCPSVSQNKLPNLNPSPICTPESSTTNSPVSPFSLPSHIHAVHQFCQFGLLNIS